MKSITLSAGIVVIDTRTTGCRFLLLRAYNYWDFPKGLVEAGESPLETACRETEEETTLRDLDFRWGHGYCETPPYGKGKVARYYVAATKTTQVQLPVSEELGRPEHDEHRWVGYREAMALLNPRLQRVLQWAHEKTACGASQRA